MYDGIVNVYKQSGFTSHDVVAKLRGIFGQKKIGHTGTLDPMAEGVLIVVLGRATKLSDLILTNRKEYMATMKLGLKSETDDITGQKIEYSDVETVNRLFSDKDALRNRLEEVFDTFVGKSMQIPPMYSAIKVNGRKLYEYAREGKVIERTPRPVEIYKLELCDIDIERREVRFVVECSKGTYIRSLIRDIGERLEVGAVMSGLLREEINGIKSSDGYRIEDLQRLKDEDRLTEAVLPMDEMLSAVPRVSVNDRGLRYLMNGNRLREDCFGFESGQHAENTGNSANALDILNRSEFFRVYHDEDLKALYTYDKSKNDYKVYKML